MKQLHENLDQFNVYLPHTQVVMEDASKAERDIKVDLKERINSYIQKIDHGFALKNYMYVIENVKDETVKDIYRSIGPFDHFEHRNVDDDDLDTQRFLRLDFDKRKSGALYRG